MKVKLLKRVNILLGSMIAILGISSCHKDVEVICKYGVPDFDEDTTIIAMYGVPSDYFDTIPQDEE